MQRPTRESHRRDGYDYSANGLFFIPIVTEDRRILFGSNKNHELRLNALGKIAFVEWEKSATIREEIFLREFIVMPNHIHGIVGINKSDAGTMGCERTHGRVSLPDQNIIPNHECMPDHNNPDKNEWSGGIRKPRSVSSFVGGYKSAVTSRVNRLLDNRGKPVFTRKNRLWQLNYYDAVIWDYRHYLRVRNYIMGNSGHH